VRTPLCEGLTRTIDYFEKLPKDGSVRPSSRKASSRKSVVTVAHVAE
jgi:hypothetical protein